MPEPADPRQGPVDPTAGTPRRRAGSIRRTSTIDSTRPAGFTGPVHQLGRARDLFTDDDGAGTALGNAEMHVVTDYTRGSLVRELSITPDVDAIGALDRGARGGGFRKVLDLETHAERGSLPYLLLDDIPGATLVSGFAMTVAADRGDAELEEFRTRMAEGPRLQVADICAGWQTGGTLLGNLENGRPPVLLGPDARRRCSTTTIPMLAHDPGAAGRLDPARPAHRRVVRRRGARRRVLPRQRDGARRGRDGDPRVHRRRDDRPRDDDRPRLQRGARVLPWRECPQAIGSAGRIVGVRVGDLRPEVRTQLVGPSTCTHLNDVLRGLEDVEWLSGALTRA